MASCGLFFLAPDGAVRRLSLSPRFCQARADGAAVTLPIRLFNELYQALNCLAIPFFCPATRPEGGKTRRFAGFSLYRSAPLWYTIRWDVIRPLGQGSSMGKRREAGPCWTT